MITFAPPLLGCAASDGQKGALLGGWGKGDNLPLPHTEPYSTQGSMEGRLDLWLPQTTK